MTDDRSAGFALILGSVGGIVTMLIHPTAGHTPLSPDQAARLALVSGLAHSLAMISFFLIFLGACGLSRRLNAPDRLAFVAMMAFGFACVAVLIETAVSGFIVPTLIQHMARDVAAAARSWQIAIDSVFQINQAFARIHSVVASVAIFVWALSIFRNRRLSRGLAIYGVVIATLVTLGIVVGHLRLDVHGMGIVVLGQALWFIIAGVELRRHRPELAA